MSGYKKYTENVMFDGQVLCPVCGCECTSIPEVRIIAGPKTAVIDGVGVKMVKNQPREYYSDAIVELSWQCENGHLWRVRYAFREGQTVKTVEYVGKDEDVFWGHPIYRGS